MIHPIQNIIAKGEAALAYVKELVVNSGLSGRQELTERFLDYLFPGKDRKAVRVVDLGEVFYFVLTERYLVLIPKARYADRETFLLKGSKDHCPLRFESIEFTENPLDPAIRIHPDAGFPAFLKKCLKRGVYREFLEG